MKRYIRQGLEMLRSQELQFPRGWGTPSSLYEDVFANPEAL